MAGMDTHLTQIGNATEFRTVLSPPDFQPVTLQPQRNEDLRRGYERSRLGRAAGQLWLEGGCMANFRVAEHPEMIAVTRHKGVYDDLSMASDHHVSECGSKPLPEKHG